MALLPFLLFHQLNKINVLLYHQLHKTNVLWQFRLQFPLKLLMLFMRKSVANKNAPVNMNANSGQRLSRLLLKKNAVR